MKVFAWLGVFLLCVAIICGFVWLMEPAARQNAFDSLTIVNEQGDRAQVQGVTLRDGTRCVVLVGQSSAISCNWKQNAKR
jgi:hypothetical protein